ncbi:MAG TPA: hypothetical protein VML55_02605 [Planctomycetaceae bacterium]|nr:hypothetical protein [Planctomycetaceae bacterium]
MALGFAKLLLITGLLLCPFRCVVKLLPCAGDAAAEEPLSRCCCCGPDQGESPRGTADSEPPQHDHERPSGDTCQCICSGAVVDKSGYDGLFDLAHAAAALDAGPASVALRTSECAEPPDPPPVLAGLNTGRATRTLHQSFLC